MTSTEHVARIDDDTSSPAAPVAPADYRILLVDDNADANESMAALLELLGYCVQTALDGPAALAASSLFVPHLVLCDIGLPGMNGYELAAALRNAAGQRNIVLAAVTGYGHESDRARSRAAGFDHHLVKPLDADVLLDFVARQAATCQFRRMPG